MPQFFIFGWIWLRPTRKNECESYYSLLITSASFNNARSQSFACLFFRKGFAHVNPSYNENLFVLIRRVWSLLNRRRKYQCVLVLGLMLFSGFAEMASLGAVVPFLTILTSPESIFQYPYVGDLTSIFGVTSADQLVLPLTVTFCIIAFASGSIRVFQAWISIRTAYSIGHELSTSAYFRTLHQPYVRHLERNSSEVIAGVQKIDSLYGVVTQMFGLVNALIICMSVVLALLMIAPLIAITLFVGFASIYGMVTLLKRGQFLVNSEIQAREMTNHLRALQEGLGGIRDVVLGGYQTVYRDIFRKADWALRKASGSNMFLKAAPQYVLETLGVLFITILAYGYNRISGETTALVPIMGAVALGARRLLPGLHQIYSSIAGLYSTRTSVEDALALLAQPLPEKANTSSPAPLVFQKDIRFESVYFRYKQKEPLILERFELKIPRGARVGFVGPTGSGKSTTLDLLMGLLLPTRGRILVDGLPLDGKYLWAWQLAIGHVPQSIFLADTTLAENIAFGHARETIDMVRVRQAAKKAHIAEFIENNTKEGYNSLIGERGIRLSGGQRQRIGIARALYKDASVLIFDEATSSLDNTTEAEVMDAIEELGGDLTILIIAHRITTVRNCDMIVKVEQGKATLCSYEQLLS